MKIKAGTWCVASRSCALSTRLASRLFTVAVLAICAAQTSLGAGPPQGAPRKIQKTGTIVGRAFPFQNSSLTPEVRVESVELFIKDDRFKSAEARVDEEGRFVFNEVPSGRVRLQPTFSAGAAQGITLSSSLTFSTTVVSGKTREATFFGRGRPVTGQILVPPGIDAKRLRVELILVAPPFRAMFGSSGNKPTPLAHVYERLRMEAGNPSASLDEHGRFRIERVREGTYWINVTDLAFANKETPGYPAIEGGKLKVDLMAGGEFHDPLELGALRFRRSARAAEHPAPTEIQARDANVRAARPSAANQSKQ